MANLTVESKILVGAESKAWLADFTKQVDRLEKLTGGKGVKAAAVEEEEAEAETETDDDDFAKPAKKASAKAAASFEDDDAPAASADAEPETDDDEDFTTPAPKKTKAKKLTVDDVNAACKARASATGGKKGRTEVLALLKKHFKTESVSELEPEQFEQCIKVMAV